MTETLLADRPFPYCKGCGHGIVARKLSDALLRLGIEPSRIVLTSDIGCVGLVDPHFPTAHTVHTIHGRSTAMAAGAVLADALLGDGNIKNLVMIGDGGATIGQLHLSQAALMNVDVTVLLHNNMLYGMTGGQHSAFTPEGFATSTTPEGNWVPAIDMEGFVRSCHGGYFARMLATDPELTDVIAEAVAHPGFAMVEILELCTGFAVPMNRMDGRSLKTLAETRGHALGVLIRDRARKPYHETYRERFPRKEAGPTIVRNQPSFTHGLSQAMTVVVAGSAGERVQSAAGLIAQAGVLSGLHCIQKNDYPVTVGSGFSLSEVKLSPVPILFTGTEAPQVLCIVSEDGLKETRGRGDLKRLATGGVVYADSTIAEGLPDSTRVHPFRKHLGSEGAALGSLLLWAQESGVLGKEAIEAAAELMGGSVATATQKVADRLATLSGRPG